MIISGERLNSSVAKTAELIKAKNTEGIKALIQTQEESGADFLDINTAMCENEAASMKWIVELVLEYSNCGIMIDSINPKTVIDTMNFIKNRPVIINSITLNDRIDELLPVIKEFKTGVIALPISASGMACRAQERLENSFKIVDKLTAFGVGEEFIYIDCITESLAMNSNAGRIFNETLKLIKKELPMIKTIGGLSNISYALPQRHNINTAFLCAAVFSGLDAAITDISSAYIKMALKAALAVNGNDEYCIDYINTTRELE